MISQTAEYALRAVVTLGSERGNPLTVNKLAERTKVPDGYLAKVLQLLGRAGMVQARRGLNGGFTLARPMEELAVLDVINAVAPLKRITRCPLGNPAHQARLCPLHRRIDAGIALMESLYGETTIAELLDDEGSDRPLCEPVAAVVGCAGEVGGAL